MLIGARQYFSGGWRNPYVTDGLVAMWDGEWNAGPGKHDANATVWKDLAGDCDAQTDESLVFDDYMYEDGRGIEKKLTSADKIDFSRFAEITIEACISNMTDSSGWHMVFGSNSDRCSLGYQDVNGSIATWRINAGNVTDRASVSGRNGTISCVYATGMASLFRNGVVGTSKSSTKQWSNTLYLTWANSWGSRRGTKRGHCFRIYSRALPAAEVAANYAIDKERFGV